MNNKCVYRHRRLDNNEIFYIGIGNYDRPFSKKGRNIYWKKIVNECGYSVEILYSDLNWEDVCELECFLIKLYGRLDLKTGKLVNMTNGGDGVYGAISKFKGIRRSDDVIDKIKKSMVNFTLTEEQKIRQKLNTPKGDKHPNFGKVSYMKGKKHSNETRKKLSGKIIICTLTNKEWYTVRDCAEDNGLNRNTLKSKLNGFLKNNTNFKYKND